MESFWHWNICIIGHEQLSKTEIKIIRTQEDEEIKFSLYLKETNLIVFN